MTRYASPNGYTGILYGTSSLKILDHKGNQVMNTNARNINTFFELKEFVDDFNNKRKSLKKLYEALSK